MLFRIRHYSDCRFTESWNGTFYDYMNNEINWLNMSYKDMLKYTKTLKFDAAGHEMSSPQVKAWMKRHNIKEENK